MLLGMACRKFSGRYGLDEAGGLRLVHRFSLPFFVFRILSLRPYRSPVDAVTGPRIDVDLCVSTYSTLKSSSILGAYDRGSRSAWRK